ncbi:MAG TPA: phytanoyl-CoA dioxygenase family protein [Rhizomicrobium sp.]|jgi:ectoine hydroxylase-related dioxygenase (phytanoyl-CoA dioxygenase family)
MSFQADGHAMRSIFPAARITALQDEISRYIDRVAKALHMPFEKSEPHLPLAERLDAIAAHDKSYANLLRMAVCTDAHRAEAFAGLVGEMDILTHVREFMGCEPEGSIVRLRANVPGLPEQRQQWHSDVARDDGTTCSQVKVTCWLPLMDAGPGSGGLEVVRGRRDGPFEHRQGIAKFEIPDAELAELPKVQPVCPAGTALFLDRFTPHRALPNLSGKARWSLVMWFRAT